MVLRLLILTADRDDTPLTLTADIDDTSLILTAESVDVLKGACPVLVSPPLTESVDTESVEGNVGVPVGGG